MTRTCRKCEERSARNQHGPSVCDECAVHPSTSRSKRCTKCGQVKPLDQFSRSKNASVWCKVCCRENAARWREQNRERYLQSERERGHRRRQDPEHRAWMRMNRLLQKYGITIEEYEALYEAQDGLCAICGETPESDRWNRLAVDHCHETGQVRGLLCGSCNRALGSFKDDPEIMQRAIAYLQEQPAGDRNGAFT